MEQEKEDYYFKIIEDDLLEPYYIKIYADQFTLYKRENKSYPDLPIGYFSRLKYLLERVIELKNFDNLGEVNSLKTFMGNYLKEKIQFTKFLKAFLEL